MGFFNIIRQILPLSKINKSYLETISDQLNKEQVKKVKKLIKLNEIGLVSTSFHTKIIPDRSFIQLSKRKQSGEYDDFINIVNTDLRKSAQNIAFKSFAKDATSIIPQVIAPQIINMDAIKRACALQLFSKERVHILLLGDPGTGKTDIIRDSAELHTPSSFGLGSGTTGVGLSVTAVGKEMQKGLLPLADEGICAIDELNLLAEKDRAALYNAMEKGFVTYNKKNLSEQFDARVRILATANPKGDAFVGKSLEILKKQIPFDSALLTRFHLIFFIRKPNVERFVDITKHIVTQDIRKISKEDKEFIQDYISYAEDIEVHFPKTYEKQVVEFSKKIKEREQDFLTEISPRTIIGVIRLAQASARMRLKHEVEPVDLKTAMDLLQLSLEINK